MYRSSVQSVVWIALLLGAGLFQWSCSSGIDNNCPSGWAWDHQNERCISVNSGGDTFLPLDTTQSDTQPQPDTTTTGDSVVDAGADSGVEETAPGDVNPSGSSLITTLSVKETAGIPRVGEVLTSGIPMPRSRALTSIDKLAVLDPNGKPVPATFKVLARWNAGRSAAEQPIQWLLVMFPANVEANQSVSYSLVLSDNDQHRPAHPTPLQITQNGNSVVVDTGVAQFSLGESAGRLFNSIKTADGTQLVSGGTIRGNLGNQTVDPATIRKVWIEHQDALSAVVQVSGEFDMPPVGGGTLSYLLRYRFTAGSPTALVRQVVTWEGDRCGHGVVVCDNAPNGLQIDHLRSTLKLVPGGTGSLLLLGARDKPGFNGSIAPDGEASLRQLQRSGRLEPLRYELEMPGLPKQSGTQADGGMLALTRGTNTLAISLFQMHRYEPQALRVLQDNSLAVDLVDAPIWLANNQGLFVRLAVAALGGTPDLATLNSTVWAPLNRPLRAWPSAAWFRDSLAVDEFPVGPLPDQFKDYDTQMTALFTQTIEKRKTQGLVGLMVNGLFPRYWSGYHGYEVECTDNTPNDSSDNTFWCSTWTDYHNTLSAVPIYSMRSGDVRWLDELALPGALRQLHTQIYQCSPDDTDFYCGQSPAGYGGYRSDFNSSHAYFDNLMLYYWLSGDYSVVQQLKRGATTMRGFLCPKRPGGNCDFDEPNSDIWAALTGRVTSQWFAVFRFVGLASDDAGFLVDFRTGLARAMTLHFARVSQNNVQYGFWSDSLLQQSGTYTTGQLWMASLYDMNNIYRLMIDTGDAPTGDPALKPSEVLISWALTLRDFGSGKLGENPVGDGTAAGIWSNVLEFQFSGSRIGGSLLKASHTYNQGNPDSALYGTGKATLAALMLRAAALSGDASLRALGLELAKLGWAGSVQSLSSNGVVLGKVQGLYLARIHAAIARLQSSP